MGLEFGGKREEWIALGELLPECEAVGLTARDLRRMAFEEGRFNCMVPPPSPDLPESCRFYDLNFPLPPYRMAEYRVKPSEIREIIRQRRQEIGDDLLRKLIDWES